MKNLDSLVELLGESFLSEDEDTMDKITLKRLENISKASGKNANTKESSYQVNEDDKITMKNIATCKAKVRTLLIDFLNVVTGVGLDDTKLDNAGEPSKEVFETAKKKLLSQTDQLIKYEDKANKTYRKEKRIGQQIYAKVSRVYYNELDFEEKDTPRSSKELLKDYKANIYTGLKEITDDDGHKRYDVSGLKPMGKPMYNADIYEELFPFVSALHNKTFDDYDFVKDQMSKVETNYATRKAKMEKALYSDNEEEYIKARNNEKNIDNLIKAKENLSSTKKDKTEIKSLSDVLKDIKNGKISNRSSEEMAKYQVQHKQGQRALQGSNEDVIKYHGMTPAVSETKALLNKWVKENAPVDDKHTILAYGLVSSKLCSNRNGFGDIGFVPELTPKHPQPLMYKGLPLFKLNRDFFKKLTEEQKKYVKMLTPEEKKEVDNELNNYNLDEEKYKSATGNSLANALNALKKKSSIKTKFNY